MDGRLVARVVWWAFYMHALYSINLAVCIAKQQTIVIALEHPVDGTIVSSNRVSSSVGITKLDAEHCSIKHSINLAVCIAKQQTIVIALEHPVDGTIVSSNRVSSSVGITKLDAEHCSIKHSIHLAVCVAKQQTIGYPLHVAQLQSIVDAFENSNDSTIVKANSIPSSVGVTKRDAERRSI